MNPTDMDVDQLQGLVDQAQARGLDSSLVLQTIIQLAPISAELAQRCVDVCKEASTETLDDLEMSSPHEIFGVLIDKAHAFIQRANAGEEAVIGCLEALREINLEVTLFLYAVQREIFNGQEEETSQGAVPGAVAEGESHGGNESSG